MTGQANRKKRHVIAPLTTEEHVTMGQVGFRKLLYYKAFPEQSTPVFMVSVCSSVKKRERLRYYKRPL